MTAQEHYEKADALAGQGKWDQAQSHFDKAILALEETRDDGCVEDSELLACAYHGRSMCFFDKMDVQKALMDINAACELNPEDWYIWLHMGNIYGQMKRYEKALEYHAKGSQLAPDEGILHWCMGVTHEKLGNDAVAERCFKEAEKLGFTEDDVDRAF